MAVSLRTLTLCFFVLFVALATSAKDSSKEDGANSASMENHSSSDEHSDEDSFFEQETTAQSSPKPPMSASTDATPPMSPTDFCRSNISGNYINPNDCKTYIACSNGYAYVMPCPANLVYNEGGWCDYIQNVPRCM